MQYKVEASVITARRCLRTAPQHGACTLTMCEHTQGPSRTSPRSQTRAVIETSIAILQKHRLQLDGWSGEAEAAIPRRELWESSKHCYAVHFTPPPDQNK